MFYFGRNESDDVIEAGKQSKEELNVVKNSVQMYIVHNSPVASIVHTLKVSLL